MSVEKEITLHLPGGSILALSDGKLIRARGIPYATAKRFRPPQAVSPWDGVRDCTKPASVCYQNPSRLWAITGELEKGREQSEDCQHVSVVALKSAFSAPVMVFFHGGAYVSGGGDVDSYSPLELAKKGVVAVNVTHRLGVFGYLPIPDIAPANLSILDQIAALEWVQRNIHVFGGDPRNVTLYGQSAGADTIYCLCVSGIADHLFERGILQSPPFAKLQDRNRQEMLQKMSLHVLQGILSSDGMVADVSAARILELNREVLGIARATSNSLLPFGPVFGESPLPPESELHDRFMAAARQKRLLIGCTAQEETAFAHIDSREGAREYHHHLFQGSTNNMLEAMAKDLGEPPASYEFTWHPEGCDLKATHCLELVLLLGDWDAWKNAPMVQGKGAKEAMEGALGEAIKNFWVAFAKGEDLGSKKYILDGNFTWP